MRHACRDVARLHVSLRGCDRSLHGPGPFPVRVLVVNSFASEHAIINYGYSFVPRELSRVARTARSS